MNLKSKQRPLALLVAIMSIPVLAGVQRLAFGQEPPQRIEAVEIRGNRSIPETTIRFHIQTKANDPYNEDQILRDYRSLLNTNFFVECSVLLEEGETGAIVIFEVRERPILRGIEYEGMKSFKESDVLEQFRDQRVNLTPDSRFDEARLPRARRALRSLLENNGRPLGRVEVEVENITSSAVRVIFKIDEGPKVRIGKISFEGNTVIEDEELKSSLELNKPRGPIVMFKGHDKYIPDKLEFDVQVNLLEKYREQGYINAKAGDPEVEIVEGPRGLLIGFRKTQQQYYITIPIEEGEQFRFGEFKVVGPQRLPEELLRQMYGFQPGDIVNMKHLRDVNEAVEKLYAQQGFLDMDVFPEWGTPDPDTNVVALTMNVTEGNQYTVDQINFAGNTKTRDRVLRREFVLQEKESYNGRRMEASILRLNQLGFFEPIEEKDWEVIKDPAVSEVDILVKVKERSQQSIGFTGGLSGISGNFFGINYSTNNFRGTGDRIDVNILTGTRTTNFQFGYTKPYVMDTPLSLGITVFNQRFRFDTFTAFFGLVSQDDNLALFTRNSTGFTVSGSYPIANWTRAGLRYSLQTIKIDDIADQFENFALNQLIGFSPGGSIEDARKGIIRSEITPTFLYNTKNAFFNATRGTQIQAEVPISGGPLGGSFNLIKPFVELQHFRPDTFLSGGRHTLAFRARFSYIFPYGKTPAGEPQAPPFFERFFMGGEFDVRGFDIRSVSPFAFSRTPNLDQNGRPLLDPATGLPSISEQIIPVGGDTSFVFTTEYRVPIAGPLNVSGFLDVGTSTVLNKDNLRIFGPNTFIDLLDDTNNVIRASTGVEVQFLLPVVNQPFRLIFAYNPLRLSTDVVFNGVRFPLQEPRSNMKFTVGYNF